MNDRLFAIGDIHGCFKSFQELIENWINLQVRDKLVLLGDYIDRGNQSKDVVDYIIQLQYKGYDVIPLMGNHEKMLLEAFEDGANLPLWIYNGGFETFKSFGIGSINELSLNYIDFFKGLKYYCSIDRYLFVHAGFNDEIENPFEDKHSMIWSCRKEYRNTSLTNKVIVHGHCPNTLTNCKAKLLSGSRIINLDTGCVYADKEGYGKLTALELNSLQMYSV